MVTKQEALAVATVVAIVVIVSAVLLYYSYRMGGHGVIKTVGCGVYTDAACTLPCTEIDWGFLSPGQVSKVTLYIKNTGNAPINLTLSIENWEPVTASVYLTYSWNYTTGQTLEPSEVVIVDLFLTVSPDIVGITEFSNDIIITAEG